MKPQKHKKPNMFLLAAVVITLAVIASYRLIPSRVYTIVPSENWRSELFIDYGSNERGIVSWVDQKDYHFHCDVQKNGADQFCGINLFYDWNITRGVDLSVFDSMKIKAKYSGDAQRARIFFRNFNPEYSDQNDGNSAKYISINLLMAEFNNNKTVTIGFDEFVVADWWLSQQKLERKYMTTEFSNVTVIGIDYGPYLINANNVDLKIESIRFEGELVKQEHWYLGILIFWGATSVFVVVYQYISLWRRSRVFTKVITELVTDKAHLEKESKKFQDLSNLDGLTGALNRLGVEKSIDSIITGQRSKVIGLILIDIDHFKRVNDHRGHDVGDLVLKTVVELIQNNIREHDVLGRWGGEEFVLITPNADEEVSFRIAEKIRNLLADHVFNIDKPLKVTASFGVTSLHLDESFDAAFKRADIALYNAKAQGRNCTVIAVDDE